MLRNSARFPTATSFNITALFGDMIYSIPLLDMMIAQQLIQYYTALKSDIFHKFICLYDKHYNVYHMNVFWREMAKFFFFSGAASLIKGSMNDGV